MAGGGRWRRSLSGRTEENQEIRNQVSQSTGCDASTAPVEYEAIVPTTDHCSVLRCFKGSHLLRRSLYHGAEI